VFECVTRTVLLNVCDQYINNFDTSKPLPENKIRISFKNNLAPVIQPILKVSGAKYFITGVKIKALEPVL
jgi:hypothetical protein